MNENLTAWMHLLPIVVLLGGITLLAWIGTSVQIEHHVWVRFVAVQMQHVERLLVWAGHRFDGEFGARCMALSDQFDVRNHHWAAEAVGETCLGCLLKADFRMSQHVYGQEVT